MYITEKKLFQYGLYSNAIYVFLMFLFRPNGINIEKLSISCFLVFSVLAVFSVCIRNRKQLNNISVLDKRVFWFLILWSTITTVRGFTFNIQDWVTNFGNVYMALAWFTPILIIVGQKVENWKIVFKSIFFMFQLMLVSLLFLSTHYARPGKLKTEWTWLLRPLNFMFIIGVKMFKANFRLLVYIIFFVYILIAILTEQRIEFIYLFIVAVLVFVDNIKQLKIRRKFLKLIVLSFLFMLILVFTYGYENLTNIFLNVVEFKDTRVFLYNELFEELSFFEEIVGRGSLGTYYSYFMDNARWYIEEILNEEWFGDSSDRITIEVGYLQMILKGGFLLFLPTIYLMLHSSYLAIFKSNNKFIKRLGIYILIISILSVISFRPAFTPTFIILWTAIGTTLNKSNRLMSDEEINKLIY